MPKKMGINSKAVESRERKAMQKKETQAKAAKAAEDALWADEDKQLAKKKSRKEEEDRKKAELLRRKAENKAMLEQEMLSIKTAGKPSIQKVTQAQINAENERRQKVVENIYKSNKEPEKETKLVSDEPLIENLNRLDPDAIEASGIDEAIKALSMAEGAADKHPEKRLKAAFKAYEAENLPRIKAENPSMRLSQWKQILFKEWTKSPQNPLNQVA
ncbi:coiled-coil domain-containing protein 124 [Sitodiplosis mosellana]|uniref:coiled-coil domain-containing protein 124 n=1 Tax=Sitodiplosis mosellana TaxID=263140 RepID=UPI0024449A4A|nr:coiled-coil domain-containing protein 124 [Sitodiplosis mosellana]